MSPKSKHSSLDGVLIAERLASLDALVDRGDYVLVSTCSDFQNRDN